MKFCACNDLIVMSIPGLDTSLYTRAHDIAMETPP